MLKSNYSNLDEYSIDYLYHITHIKNLNSILSDGINPNNEVSNFYKIRNTFVSYRRYKLDPLFKKRIDSYIPFYFNPKNPMLYVNREIQNDLAILGVNRDLILKEDILFTDGNASSSSTRFYNNIVNLNLLNWNCINGEYWHLEKDCKRIKMAEILIPRKVNVQSILKIITLTKESKNICSEIIQENNLRIESEVKKQFYFISS